MLCSLSSVAKSSIKEVSGKGCGGFGVDGCVRFLELVPSNEAVVCGRNVCVLGDGGDSKLIIAAQSPSRLSFVRTWHAPSLATKSLAPETNSEVEDKFLSTPIVRFVYLSLCNVFSWRKTRSLVSLSVMFLHICNVTSNITGGRIFANNIDKRKVSLACLSLHSKLACIKGSSRRGVLTASLVSVAMFTTGKGLRTHQTLVLPS